MCTQSFYTAGPTKRAPAALAWGVANAFSCPLMHSVGGTGKARRAAKVGTADNLPTKLHASRQTRAQCTLHITAHAPYLTPVVPAILRPTHALERSRRLLHSAVRGEEVVVHQFLPRLDVARGKDAHAHLASGRVVPLLGLAVGIAAAVQQARAVSLPPGVDVQACNAMTPTPNQPRFSTPRILVYDVLQQVAPALGWNQVILNMPHLPTAP